MLTIFKVLGNPAKGPVQRAIPCISFRGLWLIRQKITCNHGNEEWSGGYGRKQYDIGIEVVISEGKHSILTIENT